MNHVERFIIDEGHTAQRFENDYGYDLSVSTYDEQGYVEPGAIYVQLKASETLTSLGGDYVFDVEVRDWNLWTAELMPVFLVLFDAARRRAYWLHIQGYCRQDPSRRPKKGSRTVRVRVPVRQVVNRRAVARMRARKQEIIDRLGGVIVHG